MVRSTQRHSERTDLDFCVLGITRPTFQKTTEHVAWSCRCGANNKKRETKQGQLVVIYILVTPPRVTGPLPSNPELVQTLTRKTNTHLILDTQVT